MLYGKGFGDRLNFFIHCTAVKFIWNPLNDLFPNPPFVDEICELESNVFPFDKETGKRVAKGWYRYLFICTFFPGLREKWLKRRIAKKGQA